MSEMTSAVSPDVPEVRMKTKLAFGIGSTAETLSLYSYAALVTLYYNQLLGIEIWMAGLAPTIAILVDAISDPFMGSFSDRFRSKRWGRRHPFMLVSPPLIAIAFWCIYNPPAGFTEMQLFAWLTFWAIALRTFMTIYHVPHLALGSELSPDYLGRSKIMSYNNFFGWLGGAVIFKLNTVIFFASSAQFANGLLNPGAYFYFSTSIASFILVVLFASAWFTRDRIPYLPQSIGSTGFSAPDLVSDLVRAFTNHNYLFLMFAYLSLSLMLGVRSGIGTYMEIYYWELSSERIGDLRVYPSILGFVLGFVFAARFHSIFEKRHVMWVMAVLLSIFPALPVILRLMGLFPDNHAPSLFMSLAVCAALGSIPSSILNISVMSALGDVADEIDLKHKLRQEGILYSARTFFAKLDSSIGHGIATFAMWMIAFPKNAIPGEVDPDTIWWLGVIDSPMTILPGLLAAYFYSRHRIDRAAYEKTRAALDLREAG